MKWKSIKINHYRSITSEFKFEVAKGLTLVGPNNTGKTNILKAIELFFGAKRNPNLYQLKKDIPFSSKKGQSSFTGTFEIENTLESELKQKIKKISKMVGIDEPKELTIYLTFSKQNGNASYRLYSGVKRLDTVTSNEFTALERKIVEEILSKFDCIYVPSAKSVDQLYKQLVLPYLRKAAANKLLPSYNNLKSGLQEISESINSELSTCGLEVYKTQFKIPEDNLIEIISSFDFSIRDSEETDIFSKGMGVQCAALFSSFKWITEQKQEEGKSVIWLIEEPESFLHPELTRNCKEILDNLTNNSQVIITTHSLAFVESDPNKVIGVTKDLKGNTIPNKYKKYSEATKSIRESLGVRFSDFFNFSELNLFVEGQLDREYIYWFIAVSTRNHQYKDKWPLLRHSEVFDFGGVSFLTGFLRSNYSFLQKDTVSVSVFDGDEKGVYERKGIQSYITQKLKLPFDPLKQFISIRSGYAIEGLFSDEALLSLRHEHEDYFKDFSIDIEGSIEPFDILDSKKRQAFNYLTNLCNSFDIEDINNWGHRWITFCDALEDALLFEVQRLKLDPDAIISRATRQPTQSAVPPPPLPRLITPVSGAVI